MGKVWKFCENTDLQFKTKHYVGEFENEWLKLDGHTITIFGSHMKGYAWDGCSIKWVLLDLYFGTPDGVVKKQACTEINQDEQMISQRFAYVPKTYFASMVHDILYQFKATVPVSRITADKIFLEIMETNKFKLAKVYYSAVRLFGGIFGEWKTK